MKSYKQILTEAISEVTINEAPAGIMGTMARGWGAARKAGASGVGFRGGSGVAGMAGRAANVVGGNLKTSLAVAGVGAIALMRMKKNKCRQNCAKTIMDPMQRQSCIKQC